MDIVNIEKDTFEEMLTGIASLTEQADLLCNRYSSKKLDEWLDGQEVCLLLNISPRTLQSYRDSGKISFSQINRKIYYRVEDIEHLVNENIINANENKDGINNKEK